MPASNGRAAARDRDEHPLDCIVRVPDRLLGTLVPLVTGLGVVDVEALMGNRVSDATLRDRRVQWIRAGVFHRLADEAVGGY